MSSTPVHDLTATLARTLGEQPAVVLVHSGAIVAHATAHWLIDTTGHLAVELDRLTALHPGLHPLADPAVNPGLHNAGADQQAAVTGVWSEGPATARGDAPRDPACGHTLGDLYQHLSVEARKGRA
ncbi:hypothetical protein ACIBO5_52270 [Nonomuraea angiospora]|uniref:hypothetical protein n=1 Tax=Nonomuraea angiospora TaxID=46172 RepID=UPI00378F0D55